MSRLCLAVLCAVLLPLAGCDMALELDEIAPQTLPERAAAGAARCPNCGWIEARREILPLQVFEYTARMGDGSRRIFQETLPTSWRVGERLTIIDGSAAIH